MLLLQPRPETRSVDEDFREFLRREQPECQSFLTEPHQARGSRLWVAFAAAISGGLTSRAGDARAFDANRRCLFLPEVDTDFTAD